MAVTLQITDGTTTVDFTTTTGHHLLADYLPSFAMPTGDGSIPPYVTEAIPCHIYVTSGNNLAATMQSFHALQLRAAQYFADDTYETPVWFHRKLDDESGAVRYLVRSMHFTPNGNFGGPLDNAPALTEGRQGVLTIEHHPYAERTSATSVTTGTNLSVLGGGAAFNYTDVVGDVPARPYYIRLYGGSVGISFTKVWIGFRSDAKITSGDASDFVALWEVELGSNLNNAALAADATASPGGGNTKITASLPDADTTWRTNFDIDVDRIATDAGVSADAFNGAFVVLCRAKVPAGTAQVKLQHQLVDADGPSRFGPVVEMTGTSWTIYNMGLVTMPTRNRRAFPIALKNASHDRSDKIVLWSRRKAAATATTLDIDCFVLIPVDEYFVYVHYCGIDSTKETWIGIEPDDKPSAGTIGTVGADYWYTASPREVIGPGIPVGDGRMFICVAMDDDVAPAYNDDLDVGLSWYPRWISYRGTE